MSIVKVEIKPQEAQKAIVAFAENRIAALEGLVLMLPTDLHRSHQWAA